MKKLLVLFILVSTFANAQYTIKGSMSPTHKGDWIILSRIEGVKERFLDNTTMKYDTIEVNGKKERIGNFEFTLPANAKPGMYRAKYKLEGGGFVDFIFNKEDVTLEFHPTYPEQSVTFKKSKENKTYREFLEAYALLQRKIDSVQVANFKAKNDINGKLYKDLVSKLNDVNTIYEDRSKGMLANHFIKAAQRYNSNTIASDPQLYLPSVIDNFFNNINLNSEELYRSPFLTDRINDYVFVLNYSDEPELQQKLYKESITKVMQLINKNPMKKAATEFLIGQLTERKNPEIVDWIFAEHYNKLPTDYQDAKFRKKNLDLLRATVGRTAPDFTWKEEGKTHRLSTLKTGTDYLLVFWSTTCSHCVRDIPELYKFMNTVKGTKVVSYAIERDDFEWGEYIKQLYGWHNTVAVNPKNKWEDKVVRSYNLYSTPAYFILNKNKKIIAMPNDLKDVVAYYKKKEEIKAKKLAKPELKRKPAPKQ